MLFAEGVDLFNIVGGTHATTFSQTGFFPLGIYVPYAEAVKAAVSIPVLVTGNIQTPEQAEQILAGVKVMTGLRLEAVKDHTAVLVDRYGYHTELKTDAIHEGYVAARCL